MDTDNRDFCFNLSRYRLLASPMGLSNKPPKITLEFYVHLLPSADNDITDIFHNTIQSNTE